MSSVDPSSPEVLKAFYRRLYPFRAVFHWLNHAHSPEKLFTHREFAFTLPGDVYLRYNSFESYDDLKKQVCDLIPTRFEIGPVYTARPRDKKTTRPSKFTPAQRELVFDIDMTDYDAIRTCCSDAGICKRCWGFISAAVRVLDSAIRDQFGYEELLWVYSGRRGIHLWISDVEAMELTDQQRKALVGWLTVIGGGKESSKKPTVRVGSRTLPASLQDALDHLVDVFSDLILEEQDCFRTQEGYENLLQAISDPTLVSALNEKWLQEPNCSSEKKWADLKSEVRNCKNQPQRANWETIMQDIVLQYTYPRLDAEVSKHRNHLLKAPFCIHPKTGRICVPVDPTRIDDFDPEAVPTVDQLLQELDQVIHTDSEEHHSQWERTSLKPYVDMLENHALQIMNRVRRDNKTESEKPTMVW